MTMLTLEEYTDVLDMPEVPDEIMDKAESYTARFNDDYEVEIYLLDANKVSIAVYVFDSIEIAEVFLEDLFGIDSSVEIEDDFDLGDIDDYDTSMLVSLEETNESMSRIKSFVDGQVKSIKNSLAALKQESGETKEMVETFFRLLKSKLMKTQAPSETDIAAAIDQLKDVNKLAGLLVLFVLPGGGLLLVILNKLAAQYNINIFPSSFYAIKESVLLGAFDKVALNEAEEKFKEQNTIKG